MSCFTPDTKHIMFWNSWQCSRTLVAWESLFLFRVHLLHRSPRLLQSTKRAIVAGHMNGGVSPPGRSHKLRSTWLLRWFYLPTSEPSRQAETAQQTPPPHHPPTPMLRPNSRRYCYQATSHPSPKTVFSLTPLYSGQSAKSKNDEQGGVGGVSSTETIITLSRMSDQQLGSSRAYCGGLFRCCLGVLMII